MPDPNTALEDASESSNRPLNETPPESALGWRIDRKYVLPEDHFTYPGRRSFFNGVNELDNEHLRQVLLRGPRG